ncbi:MAG TPA: hypothetical protein VFW53_02530 [Gallionella sp.]|nr:hypothetical protein [Gallionella sp.]
MNHEYTPIAAFNIREQLFQECRVMAEYSLANGLPLPLDVAKAIDEAAAAAADASVARPDLADLVSAHQTLSELIKPALPRTILLLDQEQKTKRLRNVLGPVPIIRQMMVASMISVAFFILLALSPAVNTKAATGDILTSHGFPLLVNLLFYIAAAGLGASFAALYKANSYITQGTFDPTYHSSYWIRFCLGLIAGLVLSVMVSDNVIHGAGGGAGGAIAASGVGATGTGGQFLDPSFLRPMLAMLGGFSADLLYTILNRLVETVSSLFQGSTKNLLDMKQQEAEAQLAASKVQSQIDLAAKLVKLQQEVGSGADSAAIQAKLDKLVSDVMPGRTGSS